MERAIFCGLVLAAVAMTLPAAAQSVTAGRQIAETWCSNCHQIGAEAPPPKTDQGPPSFPAIARMNSTTEMSLAAFLSTPHGRMPDFSLSRQEIRDVSAYILSLRP